MYLLSFSFQIPLFSIFSPGLRRHTQNSHILTQFCKTFTMHMAFLGGPLAECSPQYRFNGTKSCFFPQGSSQTRRATMWCPSWCRVSSSYSVGSSSTSSPSSSAARDSTPPPPPPRSAPLRTAHPRPPHFTTSRRSQNQYSCDAGWAVVFLRDGRAASVSVLPRVVAGLVRTWVTNLSVLQRVSLVREC